MPPKPTRFKPKGENPTRIEFPSGYFFIPYAAGPKNRGVLFSPEEEHVAEMFTDKVPAFLAALQSPAGEWRPIATAPKDGVPILARHNRGTWKASEDLEKITYVVVWWDGECFNQVGPDRFSERELIHWMPLPPAPTGEG